MHPAPFAYRVAHTIEEALGMAHVIVVMRDGEVTASYDDLDALRAFAGGVSVVTFEFENVPAEAVAAIVRRKCPKAWPKWAFAVPTKARSNTWAILS